MKKRFSFFVFILLLIIIIPIDAFAQQKDIGIKIAILPFDNKSKNADFDYLSQLFQQSIYASITQQEGIKVIPNAKATQNAKEVGLTLSTLSTSTITLKFAVKCDINVIILGSYDIDSKGKLFVTTYVYSVAQKNNAITIVKDGTDIFQIIDDIALNTSKELKARKSEIEIALEDIMKDIDPPAYISEPKIKDISVDGVRIEWQTNKETVSTLYIGVTPNFVIDKNTPAIDDQSEDAKNHYVIVGYNIITPTGEYYFKTKDQDLFNNVVSSKEEPHIEKNEIYEVLSEEYELSVKNLYDEVEKLKKEGKFDESLDIYKNVIEINNKYIALIEVKEEKEEMDIHKSDLEEAAEVMVYIRKAENNVKERKFFDALSNYQEAYEKIGEYQIENFISPEKVNNEIRRMNAAIQVENIIAEGDNLKEEKKNKEAAIKYREAEKIVKAEKIGDLFPDLRKKIESVDGPITKFYIDAGGGAFMNFDLDFAPLWNVSFMMRINKYFSWGVGVNLFSPEVFAKFSFVNTSRIEFLVKGSALVSILPFGVGGDIALGLNIRITDLIGIDVALGAWTAYYFQNNFIPGLENGGKWGLIYPYALLSIGFNF